MPPGHRALGLDIGTQGAKAIVYDPRTKRVLARGVCGGGEERRRRGRPVPGRERKKTGARAAPRQGPVRRDRTRQSWRPFSPARPIPGHPRHAARRMRYKIWGGDTDKAPWAGSACGAATPKKKGGRAIRCPPHPPPNLHSSSPPPSLPPAPFPPGAKAYDLLPTTVPGRAEQDPATWLDGGYAAARDAVGALAAVGARPGDIGAVGVSGQQHGCVVLDAAGAPLRPAKLWCDTEAAPQAAALTARWGTKAGAGPVVPAFTVAKIAWLAENEPATLAKAAAVMLPHDFVNFVLTGGVGGDRPAGPGGAVGGLGATTDAGDASGSGLFDPTTRAYDPARLADPAFPARLGSLLPAVLPPDACAGTLCAAAAKALGGLTPGTTLVSAGTGDNQAAALGVGAVVPGASAVASLGTSGTLFAPAASPITDPTGAIAPFCDAAGQWLPLLCTLNCTVPAEEVRLAAGLSHAAAAAAAAAHPPGCGGLAFLPYLAGERTPNWPHASGAVVGLRPGSVGDPGLLYRAALEGATFGLLAGLDALAACGAPRPAALTLVGGGSKSALWRAIIADAAQLPVAVPAEAEAAALGAALQAAALLAGAPVAAFVAGHAPPPDEGGVVEPDPAHAGAYADAYAQHVALGEALFGSGAGAVRAVLG